MLNKVLKINCNIDKMGILQRFFEEKRVNA